MAKPSLAAQLEAILFASPEPLTLTGLAKLMELPQKTITAAIEELQTALQNRGIQLATNGGTYQLVTAPWASDAISRLGQQSSRAELSPAALETLAIVAYQGPVTRSTIDSLRGVSSETSLRGLLGRSLVEEAGRSPEPGKPPLYRVTQEFLQQFGVTSTAGLPRPASPTPEESHAR